MGYTTYDRLPDDGTFEHNPSHTYLEFRTDCFDDNENDDQLLGQQGHGLEAYWDLQYRQSTFYGRLNLINLRGLCNDTYLWEGHQAMYHRAVDGLNIILSLRAYYHAAIALADDSEDQPSPPFPDTDGPLPPEASLLAEAWALTTGPANDDIRFHISSSGLSSREIETSFDDALNEDSWRLQDGEWLSLAAETLIRTLLTELEEDFIRDFTAEYDRCWDSGEALEESLERDHLFDEKGNHVDLDDLSTRQQHRGEKKLRKARARLKLLAREAAQATTPNVELPAAPVLTPELAI